LTDIDLTTQIPQNDVVHAALDGARAPAHGQPVGDGVEVLLEALGEGGDPGQGGLAGGGHPLRQILAGQLGDHGGEAADLAGCGLEFGAAVQDGFELEFLVLGQGVGAAAEPVRDVADGGRGRGQWLPGGAVAGEVVADDGVAAVVAEGLDLEEQPPDAAVGAVGVLVQVGLERVELARPRSFPASVGEFLPGGGAVEALDGVQAPAQVAGDLPQAPPLGAQPADQLVVAPGALGVLPDGVGLPGGLWFRQGRGLRVRGRRGRPGQAGAVGGDALLDGLGEVLPQVEPVGDLDRVRRAGPGAVGVGAGAVSADDLDAGVRGQPVRQRLRVAAFEEVQRGAGLDVDDQRAVVLAAADREVVDPGHPRRCRCRVGDGHDEPQQGLPGRRDGQAGGQPGARPPCQRDRDAPEHAGQQRRLARVAAGQPVDLLGERRGLAAGGRAEEPPDRQHDLHLPPADGGVGQRP